MDFDISKLSNTIPNADILNILKKSESLLKNEKLKKSDLILLGKSLDTIQKKTILDKFVEFFSHITPKTHDNFLINRAKSYENVLQSSKINKIFVENEIDYKKGHLLEQFQSNLGLQFASPEKKEFLAHHMQASTVSDIINGQSRLPVIQEMLTALADKYAEWGDENDELSHDEKNQIQELKEQLVDLHKNLETASQELKKTENDEIQEALRKNLNSKKVTVEASKDSFAMNEIKKNAAEKDVKPAQHPISRTIIQLTANLFSVIRSVKSIVSNQSIEDPQNRQTANVVIPIKDPDLANTKKPEGETIAYYKEGVGKEKASGQMEKLMWELSGLLGVESMFAPTATVSLKDNSGQERAGGVQVAQEGVTLNDYLDNPKRKVGINQGELIKGTLVTLALGMFDAHAGNVLVDKAGHLKFFDNTRSMPNSNGVVRSGFGITSSYRSGLLRLEGNLKTLTQAERASIAEEIQNYQSKIKVLENFLNNPKVNARIETLPSGWLESQDSLNALKERINLLELAIQNPEVKNLRDLVFACNPEYKYFAALHLFNDALSNPTFSLQTLQEKKFGDVGFSTLSELVEMTANNSVDPAKVRDWCNDSKLSFEDVLQKMIRENKEKAFVSDNFLDVMRHRANDPEIIKMKENGKKIIAEYSEKAKVDFKDIPRQLIPQFSFDLALENLKNTDLEIFDNDFHGKNAINKHFINPDHKLLIYQDSSKQPAVLTLYYRDIDQTVKDIQIDYSAKPGLLKIGDNFLKAEEIAANFTFIQ